MGKILSSLMILGSMKMDHSLQEIYRRELCLFTMKAEVLNSWMIYSKKHTL